MKTRFLGRTGIKISELCLGTVTFGGLGNFESWGQLGQKEADAIVGMALEMGINFFDSAEMYSDGLAEEMLGKALGTRRKDAIVTTKATQVRGPGPNDGGLSRIHIIEACNASLKRLSTDYIDLYQVHGFDPYTPLEETLRALDDLVHQGKVRYIGCSNFTGWQLMKALAISEKNGWEKFVTLESMYSLASRGLEFELVPLCLDQKVGILSWSPLHGGILSGKYRRDYPWPQGTRYRTPEDRMIWPFDREKIFDVVEELDRIAKEHNVTVPQAALNYVLRKPAVNSLVIGFRTAEQIAENIKTTDWEMTPEEVGRLDSLSQPISIYPYYSLTGRIPIGVEAVLAR